VLFNNGKAALRKIRRSKDGFDFAQSPDFDYDQRAISLSYIDATPTGLGCAFCKVEQILKKQQFTQFREFLHDS